MVFHTLTNTHKGAVWGKLQYVPTWQGGGLESAVFCSSHATVCLQQGLSVGPTCGGVKGTLRHGVGLVSHSRLLVFPLDHLVVLSVLEVGSKLRIICFFSSMLGGVPL